MSLDRYLDAVDNALDELQKTKAALLEYVARLTDEHQVAIALAERVPVTPDEREFERLRSANKSLHGRMYHWRTRAELAETHWQTQVEAARVAAYEKAAQIAERDWTHLHHAGQTIADVIRAFAKRKEEK